MEEMVKQSKGMAIASMVLGIVGLVLSCLVIGIIPCVIGLILGIVVLVKQKAGLATGRSCFREGRCWCKERETFSIFTCLTRTSRKLGA